MTHQYFVWMVKFFFLWNTYSYSALHKKWSFPLWISSVNVTKSAHSLKKSLMENFIFCSVLRTLVSFWWEQEGAVFGQNSKVYILAISDFGKVHIIILYILLGIGTTELPIGPGLTFPRLCLGTKQPFSALQKSEKLLRYSMTSRKRWTPVLRRIL